MPERSPYGCLNLRGAYDLNGEYCLTTSTLSSDIVFKVEKVFFHPNVIARKRSPHLEQPSWKITDLSDQAILADAMQASESLIAAIPGALREHDPSWIAATTESGTHTSLALTFGNKASMIAFGAIVIQPSTVPFTLGEVTFGNYKIEQLTMYGEPLVSADIEESHKREIFLNLFDLLRKQLTPRQVILLLCVPCKGPLYKILTSTSRLKDHYHVLQYAADYKRRLIALPQIFDEYLKQLGSRTRSDLNRNFRKLKEHANNAISVKCYTDTLEVKEFLASAEVISKKTYQWNLLGRGLRDQERFRSQLTSAAERGWLRCYVLFCREKPVAFMVGYLHRGRYYSTDIGYDPEWTPWSVGNVLHCEVVRDLIEGASGAKLFDFMGDRPTQERLSNNVFEEEAAFYLFPKSLEGTALYLSLQLTDKLSILLSHILETLQLKTRIRKLVRQISTKRGSG